MTEQHERSLYEEIAADERGSAELALAAATLRMGQLFEYACDLRPDITPAHLASVMGVDETRVCALIEGDERLSFEAFNRYASVLGYRLVMNLEPKSAAIPELPVSVHHYPSPATDHFRHRAVGMDGVSEVRVLYMSDGAPLDAEIEAPEYIGTTYPRGQFEYDRSRSRIPARMSQARLEREWVGVPADV